ncbi:MAG: SpoIIE family protein phosphatase, partial [Ignavibacterium sp.]|nr:SpoIIE family protein phosphatase [Ignavibacterium sp.]
MPTIMLIIGNYASIIYTEEENNIFRRFAVVFEQSYTRFLDLQKAESQAREAKIEAALEKVRSRTMAMQKSEELAETAAVLFQQLNELGYIPDRITIGIMKEDVRSIELWSTDQVGNQITHIFKPSIDEPTTWSKIYVNWKAKKRSVVIDLSGLELNEWIRYVREEMHMFINEDVLKENRRVHSVGFFSQGFIMMSTIEALSVEKIDVLERFSLVFNQTYTRFLDLQKAEAQAREAQIEAALERVRAKTLAMQQSDELIETSAVVFKQLINLGIEPNRIYIAIIKDETEVAEFWITDEDGSKVSTGFTINLNENISFRKMYSGWKEQKKSIILDLQGEELEKYFSHLSRLNVPFKEGFSQKRRIQNIAYFTKGFIGVVSPDETKPETIQLLERFAAVFNLTYTRFNDLKQAEAQNRIIQAENERKTKELEDARQLQLSMLPKELPKLPHLDIAVYMKTATEVGGDYYDFNVDDNGTLTILAGDATGHGMMSGMMVSIMKSFFISNRKNIELKQFFENSNLSIKDMQLGRLMMACIGVQITPQKVIATNAGMPSLLYFRNKSQKAGEFVINNMPLGAMKESKYELKKINYEKGDTLLLMSDGFAELKNKNEEQYGYERVKEEFKSVVKKSADEIIEHLNNSASEWANGVEPDDD